MKTMAIRLSEETSEQLALVARLENSTIIDLIRQAVDRLLADKWAEGKLAERAAAVLAEIDEEAAAKRGALQALLTKAEQATPSDAPKGRSSRRPTGTPEDEA